MGTTLTGTTPQDTYDSLIKVTDNGPLSGSLKTLTDGLGNDSALALSTGAASITGTLAATAGANFATSSGNVGIGTSSPNYSLQVNSATTTTRLQITNTTTGTGSVAGLQIIQDGVNTTLSQKSNGFMSFETNNTERFRVTANGVTFNGDTAAANALDDYEEGTFTPVLRGSGTAGTYEATTAYGLYTKIGRQVTANIFITFAASVTGGGTGYAQITGLPFAKSGLQQVAGTAKFNSADFNSGILYVTCEFTSATNASSVLYFPQVRQNSNPIDLPIAALGNNSNITVTITYFV